MVVIMINSKRELINELIENNGRVYLPDCMLLVNGLAIDNIFEMIYLDGTEFLKNDEDDMVARYSEEDFLLEFCDINLSTLATMPLSELNEFEILFEYDENGFIKDN